MNGHIQLVLCFVFSCYKITCESCAFVYNSLSSKHDNGFLFQNGAYSDAMTACNEVLEVDENNVDALCDRAEAKINNEMYEEGM